MAAPLAALLVLAALPYATTALIALTGNPNLESELALERLPTTDPLGAAIARLWIEQQPPNMDYYHAMTASNTTQSSQRPAVPATTFASTPIDVRAPLPNVFIFLIDSLRRDYLSPYNPAVTFTPSIARLAADSYVFRNAFTSYGGTWMSIPGLWTGTPLTRGWGQVFKQLNALEPLIKAGGYDFVINDYTVATEFSTPQTFLNPGIESVKTDLCDNVKSLQAHIDGRKDARAPAVHVSGADERAHPEYAYRHRRSRRTRATRASTRRMRRSWNGSIPASGRCSRISRNAGCTTTASSSSRRITAKRLAPTATGAINSSCFPRSCAFR